MIDLIIIGAGPAGMTAALTAQECGLKVVVLDEQLRPGGQIYRNVLDTSKDTILGPDYFDGRTLAQRFLASGVDYRPGAQVWRIDDDGVCFTGPDGASILRARHVLLAVGAMERPVPTRGWTLPGVMTAGAAQIMLKASGVVAPNAVFIGSGPLLFLIVAQYLRAGVAVKAVLETTPRGNYASALRHAGGALRGWRYVRKGMGMLSEIRRAGVRIEKIDSYTLAGRDHLETVDYVVAGQARQIGCDTALIHQGVIPAVQASLSSGCAHDWNAAQVAWLPKADASGRTDKDWLRVAGDCRGIAGALSAQLSGELAALAIAQDQNRVTADEIAARTKRVRAKLNTDNAVRPFLDQLYLPRPDLLAPTNDDVTICRCELVTRGQIRQAVSEGCPGPNQMKAFTRSGMGPCQGRMCGPVVTQTMAAMTGLSPAAVGHYRIRSPFRPVTLHEMAQCAEAPDQKAT